MSRRTSSSSEPIEFEFARRPSRSSKETISADYVCLVLAKAEQEVNSGTSGLERHSIAHNRLVVAAWHAVGVRDAKTKKTLVRPDARVCAAWLCRAGDDGPPEVTCRVGRAFDAARGGFLDCTERALHYYTRAHEQGSPEARFILGSCHAEGRWLERDLQTAWNLMLLAFHGGNQDAGGWIVTQLWRAKRRYHAECWQWIVAGEGQERPPWRPGADEEASVSLAEPDLIERTADDLGDAPERDLVATVLSRHLVVRRLLAANDSVLRAGAAEIVREEAAELHRLTAPQERAAPAAAGSSEAEPPRKAGASEATAPTAPSRDQRAARRKKRRRVVVAAAATSACWLLWEVYGSFVLQFLQELLL
jgi:hypothetical protein